MKQYISLIITLLSVALFIVGINALYGLTLSDFDLYVTADE